MNTRSEKRSTDSWFRSGVFLNYTAEDTLKSFIMEERSASTAEVNKMCNADTKENDIMATKVLKCQQNVFSVNEKNVGSGALQNPDKTSRLSKMPFLHKNQGRAAWSCRLNPTAEKVCRSSTISKPAIKLSFSSNQNRCLNDFKAVQENSAHTKFEGIVNNLSIFNKKMIRPMELQADILEDSPNNKIVKASSAGGDKELEEFELLERIAEGHACNTSNTDECQLNQVDERSSSTFEKTAPKKCSSLSNINHDIFLKSNEQVANESQSKETVHCFVGHLSADCLQSESPKSPAYKNCQLPYEFPFEKNTRAVDANSCDFDDNLPWKDETYVEVSTDKNPDRRLSFPSVRFNIPSECDKRSSQDEQKTLNNHSNSVSDVLDSSPSAVKVWIARLKAEVNRFNSENTALTKLKMDREETLLALESEKREFEKYKEIQMKEFEAFRQEEVSKLKKERKVLSEYQKSLRSMPNKHDREEMERLRQQIRDEKEEAAQRESRLQHQLNRQKVRIEELTTERTELLERIKRLEQAQIKLRHEVAEERANHVLDYSRRNANSQSHLDTVSQAIACGSPSLNIKESMIEETQKQRAASSGANYKIQTNVPSEAPLFKSTPAYLNGESAKESSESLSACVSCRPPDDIAPQLQQLRQRMSSVASDYCKGEGISAHRACYPLNGLSNQNNGLVIRETHQPDGSVHKYTSDCATPANCPYGAEEGVYKYGRRETNHLKSLPLTSEQSKTTTQHKHSLCSPTEGESAFTQPVIVEEICPSEGMSVQIFSNGDKMISLHNGQKELHCAEFKRRIYPDGTVKTVLKDGRQETRYASGRIRVKDSQGNLLVDTRIAPISRNATINLAPLLIPPHLVTR